MSNSKIKKTPERVLTVDNKISLDPQNPIPIQYGSDSFAYVRGKKYIPFLGKDNNLPNLLLEARLTSNTQNSCISSIAASVIGNGITVLEVERPDVQLFEWMKCVNNEQDSFDDILYGIIDGERGQGNQFIEVVRGKLGTTPFMKIYLHPLQYCRFEEPEKIGTQPTHVLISKLFARRGSRVSVDSADRVPMWSPNPLDKEICWVKDEEGNFRTMLHFKNKVSGIDSYGLPASISSLRQQVIEGKLAQHNLDNLENNMVMGGMLMFKSAMTAEEALENAERIMLSHIGEGKTGRIAVISSESGLDDVKWEEYNTQREGSFIEFDKRIEEKIISANNWDGVLCGISRGGSLGNGSSYLRSIWDAKEASLLNPLRRRLTDKVVMPLMKIYADVFSNKVIVNYKFWFNSAMPFSFLGDIDPEQFMQVSEARDLAGLPPDDSKKGVYLSEMKPKIKDVQGNGDPTKVPGK